jgi:FkbM family methyltransferase
VYDSEILSLRHTLQKEDGMLSDLLDEVQADDVVWDIGANLGVYSCLAGDVVDDGSVVAVEPHPPTVSRCQENVALSGVSETVEVVPAALSDSEEVKDLHVDRDEVGTQTPSITASGGWTKCTVRTRRGDDLVGDVPAPTVVKVDVEGAERAVLNGLSETLASDDCRAVFVETHAERPSQRDSPDPLVEMLRDYGFSVEVVTRRSQDYIKGVQPNS